MARPVRLNAEDSRRLRCARRLADNITNSWVEYIRYLVAWEERQPHLSYHVYGVRTFQHFLKRVGLKVNAALYAQAKMALSLYPVSRLRRLDFWVVCMGCRERMTNSQRHRYFQGVEEFIRVNGRPPSTEWARGLLKRVAPRAIPAGATHGDGVQKLRQQLRDCRRIRRDLARRCSRLSHDLAECRSHSKQLEKEVAKLEELVRTLRGGN